jgi:glyoxylase-like metal-dependent hydrolase (beta-lactamase superfamily II)
MKIPFRIQWRLAAIIALLGLVAVGYAQRQVAEEKLSATAVRGSVHVLYSQRAGNVAVSVGPDGALVIDDHFAPVAPQIVTVVKTLTDQPIRYVLNSHWHPDHAGGNEFLGRQGYTIVAHDNVRVRMGKEFYSNFSQKTMPASPPEALPVMTFSENLTFHFNGDTVRVYHAGNAHTDGDALFHFEQANVIHAGDVFVRYGFPFVDLASDGSVAGMIAGCERILEIANSETLIIPGHGQIAREADVEEFRAMLVAARGRVQQALTAGKTADEIVAAKPLADLESRWGAGFIKADAFVRTLVTSEQGGRTP